MYVYYVVVVVGMANPHEHSSAQKSPNAMLHKTEVECATDNLFCLKEQIGRERDGQVVVLLLVEDRSSRKLGPVQRTNPAGHDLCPRPLLDRTQS